MRMDNLIIGRQPVLEALKSRQPIERILILHGTSGGPIDQAKQLARKLAIPVKETDKERFAELAGDATTQGIIAIIDNYHYAEVEDILASAELKKEPPFILILDEIEDPHNLGALIRSAECAGAHGIIIPLHNSASVNATVTKTSAGATAHLPVARVTNIAQSMDGLKKSGVWIVGTEMESDKLYYEHDYRGPLALVIGNEGKGIRRLVREKCDFLVRIPMHGKIESLNASVAGALVMFEAAKSRT
ncbi:MAG: 23S rRNA (guanosine(2251)-2'-O)-methyltransferase RlmB, partial [Ignavibacteriae bacterium]